jgi:hypothetical protein
MRKSELMRSGRRQRGKRGKKLRRKRPYRKKNLDAWRMKELMNLPA